MKEIRHIVFDIGKVLIHYDPELPYRRLIPDEAQRQWFLENVCSPAWNLEQDRGRDWATAEAELVSRYPEHEDNIRAFRRYWREMVPYHYDANVALMVRLIEAGRDVTLLTNFAADTFAEARQRFAFLKRARGITVSGEIGVVKPDRAIFEHHAKRFGLAREAVLFIDDSAHNVEGAKAAGWQAVQFTARDELERDLKRFGLL